MLDIQFASKLDVLPAKYLLSKWAAQALEKNNQHAEITLRIVDEEEGKQLNNIWRNKDSATNVLAFPVGEKIAHAPDLLGDIVICAPIVEREAKQQGKLSDAHWAHLITHGVLHLQGYNHQSSEDADIMEAKEIYVLKKLGYPNPYKSIFQL